MNKKQIQALIVSVLFIVLAFYGLLAEQIYGYHTGFRWCYNALVGVTALSAFNYAILFLLRRSAPSQKVIQSYKNGEHMPLPADVAFYTIMVLICAMSESYYIMVGWSLIGGADYGFRLLGEEKDEDKCGGCAELMADADAAIQIATRQNAEIYAELVRIAVKLGLKSQHNEEHGKHDHYMELAFRIQAKLDMDYHACDSCNQIVPTETVTFTAKNEVQGLCRPCNMALNKPQDQAKPSN